MSGRALGRRTLTSAVLAALVIAACGGSDPVAPTTPASPAATSGAAAGASSGPVSSAAPAGTRVPLPSAPILRPPAYASRVVVPELGIDLPVVSGDLQPPPSYPLCDVAAYLTRFAQPYEAGVTYISAHAREGMFLPLLEASERSDGAELVGLELDVYTNDGMRYGYRIERVNRHAVDYAILDELPLDERRLILQTSEGPFGTKEKLQVIAVPVDEERVDVAEAAPEARPRDCRPPELIEGSSPSPGPTTSPIVVTAPTPAVTEAPSAAAPSASAPAASTPVGSEPPAAPSATPGGAVIGRAEVASRVVVDDLGIDLPVVSGDLSPPPNYPFCDVAAYITVLHQPGEPGTTFLTAHAQEGMFLPILEASRRDDGRSLLGTTVDVYTTDALRYRYEIWQVRRHITDRSIAIDDLQPGEQRLVLQTSEGPYGTAEKLAVAARLLSVEAADPSVAVPEARPRDCTPPEARPTP